MKPRIRFFEGMSMLAVVEIFPEISTILKRYFFIDYGLITEDLLTHS